MKAPIEARVSVHATAGDVGSVDCVLLAMCFLPSWRGGVPLHLELFGRLPTWGAGSGTGLKAGSAIWDSARLLWR
jgi:hypothetical protein